MKIKPLFDRVVIEPIELDTISTYGIVLLQNSKETSDTGIVVAVGDGDNMDCDKCEMKLKIGDKVIFNKYAGTEMKFKNKNYVVMRQVDVIGIIEE